MYKLVAPELEVGVLDKFNERNQKTPWMWTIHNQSFQKYSGDLFLDRFLVCFSEQIEQSATEVMCVAVWISKLVGNRIQEQVTTFSIEVNSQILEDIHM